MIWREKESRGREGEVERIKMHYIHESSQNTIPQLNFFTLVLISSLTHLENVSDSTDTETPNSSLEMALLSSCCSVLPRIKAIIEDRNQTTNL